MKTRSVVSTPHFSSSLLSPQRRPPPRQVQLITVGLSHYITPMCVYANTRPKSSSFSPFGACRRHHRQCPVLSKCRLSSPSIITMLNGFGVMPSPEKILKLCSASFLYFSRYPDTFGGQIYSGSRQGIHHCRLKGGGWGGVGGWGLGRGGVRDVIPGSQDLDSLV